ncbi:hypothetical protein CHUAL_007040 [Chamberlinius hualienensis]
MIEIVKLLNWTYVSIIYEESNYGIKAFEVLEEHLGANNICIAVKERLVKDSGVAGEGVYDITVQKLLSKPRARGVIIFGSDQEVAGVMRAVRRNNATGRFIWIGSDGWSERSLVFEGNELEVEGTLSVQPMANPVIGFEEYFLNLSIKSNRRNPWFVEYWEDFFKCKYPNSTVTPYNQHYKTTCSGDEIVTPEKGYVPESQLQFVSDSVMAFAHAFKNLHKDVCGGLSGLCDAMVPIDGTQVLHYLRLVNFTGLSGDEFHFDENGDGPARYNILHFKQVSHGVFKWVRVGRYYEGVLDLDMNLIRFNVREPAMPISVCSPPCKLGQAKKYVEGEICCWHCFNCSTYQVLESETKCTECPLGTLPSADHTMCISIPEVYLRPGAGVSITAIVFSSLGIVLTAFVSAVFVKYNDTPVVRASGRELSYVLLGGIFMCYAMTYVLVVRPTDVICGVRRFGIGFCFAVVYSALLTKTNRIARIFNAGKRTTRRPSFISPRSQMVICVILVMVQIAITAVWLFFDPPRAIYHHPTREDNHLVCAGSINASYMIAFSYPISLILICTVYAILTRKIPEAFNESKYIGITMYTICIIWLAFVPIYFSTANNVAVRIITMCVSISLSATVALVCLFTPKLYIILLHPERNVRQSMMQPQKSHSLLVKNSFSTGSSNVRVDSGTQSDVSEFEMYEKLKPAGSIASSISRSTSATQTVSTEVFPLYTANSMAALLMTNCSNSTQTMDSVGDGNEFTTAQPEDVQL